MYGPTSVAAVTVWVDGEEETVEIDDVLGPIVRLDDGNAIFTVTSQSHCYWSPKMPKQNWTEMGRTYKESAVILAAKKQRQKRQASMANSAIQEAIVAGTAVPRVPLESNSR